LKLKIQAKSNEPKQLLKF